MGIIQVSDIARYDGQEVTVQGWVYNRTDKGKLVFLLVRDGSGFVQCVAFKGDLDEALFDRLLPYTDFIPAGYAGRAPICAHRPGDNNRRFLWQAHESVEQGFVQVTFESHALHESAAIAHQ